MAALLRGVRGKHPFPPQGCFPSPLLWNQIPGKFPAKPLPSKLSHSHSCVLQYPTWSSHFAGIETLIMYSGCKQWLTASWKYWCDRKSKRFILLPQIKKDFRGFWMKCQPKQKTMSTGGELWLQLFLCSWGCKISVGLVRLFWCWNVKCLYGICKSSYQKNSF